jgi:DNA (cytosine-5)-methyltransferase 1
VGFREDVGFEWPDESAWPEPAGVKLGAILERESEVDSKYVLTDGLWKYLQAYREKHSLAGNGFGFSVVTRDDTTRTLSARYHKDGSEILVHRGPGLNPRRLTPRECARLMGFEEDFLLPVSDTQLYRQFGNSVVVPAVRAVASAMAPYLKAALKNGKASGAARTFEKPTLILKGASNLPSRSVKIPLVA